MKRDSLPTPTPSSHVRTCAARCDQNNPPHVMRFAKPLRNTVANLTKHRCSTAKGLGQRQSSSNQVLRTDSGSNRSTKKLKSLKRKLSRFTLKDPKKPTYVRTASESLLSSLYESTSAGKPPLRSSLIGNLPEHLVLSTTLPRLTAHVMCDMRRISTNQLSEAPSRPARPSYDKCPSSCAIDLTCAQSQCTDQILTPPVSLRTRIPDAQTNMKSGLSSVPEEHGGSDGNFFGDNTHMVNKYDAELVKPKSRYLNTIRIVSDELRHEYMRNWDASQAMSRGVCTAVAQLENDSTIKSYCVDSFISNSQLEMITKMDTLKPLPLKPQRNISGLTDTTQVTEATNLSSRKAKAAFVYSEERDNVKPELSDDSDASSHGSSCSTLSTYSDDESNPGDRTLSPSSPLQSVLPTAPNFTAIPELSKPIDYLNYDQHHSELSETEIDNIYEMYEDEVQKRRTAIQMSVAEITPASLYNPGLAKLKDLSVQSCEELQNNQTFSSASDSIANASSLSREIQKTQSAVKKHVYSQPGTLFEWKRRLDSFPRIPSLTSSEATLDETAIQSPPINEKSPIDSHGHVRLDSGFASATSDDERKRSEQLSGQMAKVILSQVASESVSSPQRSIQVLPSESGTEIGEEKSHDGETFVERAPFPLTRITINCRGRSYPVLLSQDGQLFEAPCWKHGCNKHTRGIFGETTKVGHTVMRTFKEV